VAKQSPDLVDERTNFLDPKLRLPINEKNIVNKLEKIHVKIAFDF
jgi:hypothetical protein